MGLDTAIFLAVWILGILLVLLTMSRVGARFNHPNKWLNQGPSQRAYLLGGLLGFGLGLSIHELL